MNIPEEWARAFVTREILARRSMIESIQQISGLSLSRAEKAFKKLDSAKAFNYDGYDGVYRVKHGSFLDKDVLVRASS
jgi:hypothetical protein